MEKKGKIALIGIRGIPVVYSGYETFSEVLSTELVKKNYAVTVYCRAPYVNPKKKSYRGVELITLPTIPSKNFDTIFHSFISTVHACFQNYDTILYLSVGNSIFSFLPRIFGKRTIVNVDGMDWKRKKWGRFAKWFLNYSEYLATILPNAIVTDSFFIRDYYLSKYKKKSHYIPYGGFLGHQKNGTKLLKKCGLQKGKYFIWNGRLVPDNHIEELILAFKQVKTDFKCVILGDDLYKSAYRDKLHVLSSEDGRIIFPGFVPHNTAEILVKNAFAYVETKRSGGTHPSLVEAMSVGSLIICDNLQANIDVLGNDTIYYSLKGGSVDLTKKIIQLTMSSSSDIKMMKRNIKKRYMKYYRWQNIIDSYTRILFLDQTLMRIGIHDK